MQTKTTYAYTTVKSSSDYSGMLRLKNLKYREVDQCYIQVGPSSQVKSWILHVSLLVSQIRTIAPAILNILASKKITFKIARNEQLAKQLLNASWGYNQVGKIFSIVINDDQTNDSIARQLIEITADAKGPAVPGAAYIGGTVYVSYDILNGSDNANSIFPTPKPAWPFKEIAIPTTRKSNSLNNSHIILSIIKDSPKGRVLKTVRVRKLSIKYSLVKEARHDTATDQFDRDAAYRLKWQHNLLLNLRRSVPVPKVYELFEEDGNLYLSMEYINGTSLDKYLPDFLEGSTWEAQPASKKKEIIKIYQNILSCISKLHTLGYVHRDVTPANFLITKNKSVTLIDLENAYSINENYPSPPFNLFTQGYNAPEQKQSIKASAREDIYSLGSLLFVLTTGLMPDRFLVKSHGNLESNLSTFELPETMHTIITNCMTTDAEERPTIEFIQDHIRSYYEKLAADDTNIEQTKQPIAPSPTSVTAAIKNTITAFGNEPFTNPRGVWRINSDTEAADLPEHLSLGLFNGISGGLYTVATLKEQGALSLKIPQSFHINQKLVCNQVATHLDAIPVGLYNGAAGIAIALTQAIESSLLSNTTENQDLIQRCLLPTTSDLTVAQGIAGQLIASVKCSQKLKKEISENIIARQVEEILKRQEKDGSWRLQKKTIPTGLSDGVAGIAMGLMIAYPAYQVRGIQQTVERALAWLKKQSVNYRGTYLWCTDNKKHTINAWLANGASGIALCHLYAYKTFDQSSYLKIADDVISHLSHRIHSNNLSFGCGISGLGEVLLDYQRITNTHKYNPVIDKIAATLFQASDHSPTSPAFWRTDTEIHPDVTLLNGNSGILHFLLRYTQPERPFPIFGIK